MVTSPSDRLGPIAEPEQAGVSVIGHARRAVREIGDDRCLSWPKLVRTSDSGLPRVRQAVAPLRHAMPVGVWTTKIRVTLDRSSLDLPWPR